MSYVPGIQPKGDDLSELVAYMNREFWKISRESIAPRVGSIIFEEHFSIPNKPVERMIMNFSSSVHGISGLYQYIGGVWVKL